MVKYIMKIKKIIILMVLFIAIIGFTMSSATAFSIQKLDKNTVEQSKNKARLTIVIPSKAGSDSTRAKDLNQIKKIVIKINGKTIKTIKRPSLTWKKGNGYYPDAIIKSFKINTSVKGKKYSITTYNKNGKKLKTKSGKITSVYNGYYY